MPEWLLQKDEYEPSKDKDAFINKSILSIIKVLSRFRRHTAYKKSKTDINAVSKIIFSFILILLTALSRNMMFVVTVNVFLLFIVSLLDVEEIKYVGRAAIIGTLFTSIILIPSMLMGNGNNSILIIIKVLGTVSIVGILSSTTQWNHMMSSMKFFFIPNIFIMVLDITIKYIILLGEFSLDMLYALKVRSIGKSKNKNASLSGVMGTMFIKSKEMAEDMYDAMECRGFTGEYKSYKKFKFTFADLILIMLGILFVVIFIYFDRV